MSHKRKQEDKHRLKKLYDKTKHSYGCGAWYYEKQDRLIRYSCHNKWLRRYCRKMSRRKMNNQMKLYSKGDYNRLFDYWWWVL